MTAIIAIENKNVDDIVTVDESINDSYGSGIYISVGELISLKDLLYGLMLRSGNDAAKMISTYVSGSEDEFVKLMNKKARELGMKNTIFYNSSGLDNDTKGNISTAYDMALLTRYAMNNEIYREIVQTKKHVVKTNMKSYVWHNKNKLLSEDYITGGKTGYTVKAKRTLVSTASFNDMNLVVVTIRDSNDWDTHKSLYKKVFDNYDKYIILNKRNFKVINDKCYDKLYIKNNSYLMLKKGESGNLVTHIKLKCKKKYQSGDEVGMAYVYYNDLLVDKQKIYVLSNKRRGLFSFRV